MSEQWKCSSLYKNFIDIYALQKVFERAEFFARNSCQFSVLLCQSEPMKLPPDSLSSLQGKSLLPDPSRPSVAESGANIGQTFERMLMEVNRQHQEAEQKQVELLTASEKDIHGTVIAMEKAEISLRLLLQVRNKLTTAYEEVMRMQV